MTAQKSTAKKSYFMTNFRNRLVQNRRASIVTLILHLVGAPLCLVNAILYGVTYEKYEIAYEAALEAVGGNRELINFSALPTYIRFNEAYLVIGIIATIIAVLAGLVIAMSNFSYMYKKTQVDMVYSLPMTTTQRFLSDFTAGVTSYLAPFLASSVITGILCFIGNVACNKTWTEGFDGAGFGFQSVGQIIFQFSLYGFFFMLMIYVICVLVIVCCGNFLEAGACICVLNGLIPATIAITGFIFLGDLYGIDMESSVLPWIVKTSPIGAIVEMFYLGDSLTDDMTMWNIIWEWLLPFVAVTALYFVISLILNKYRKAEDVSKPFVYKIFYYIIITAVTFCIATIFVGSNSLNAGYVPMIIISAIVYFVAEVIENRGFKGFWKSAIRYAVTLVTLIAAIILVQVTDGFGMVYYVPSDISVKSVDIVYNGVYVDSALLDYDETIRLTEKESISAVIDTQKANLERYKKKDFYSSDSVSNVKITYNLYSGKSVTRDYSLNAEEYKMLSSIDTTDEYIEGMLDSLLKNILLRTYPNKVEVTASYKTGEYYTKEVQREKFAYMICDALKADLLEMSEEDYLRPSGECYGYVNFDSYRVPLSEDYPNVLEVMKRLGFEPDYQDIDIPTMLQNKSDIVISKNYMTYSPNYKYSYDYDDDSYTASPNISFYITNSDMKNEYRLLKELIEVSQYRYFADEGMYAINIDGTRYVIPEEYTKQAEQLYNMLYEGYEVSGCIIDNSDGIYYYLSYEDIDRIIRTIYDNGGYVSNYICYDNNISYQFIEEVKYVYEQKRNMDKEYNGYQYVD